MNHISGMHAFIVAVIILVLMLTGGYIRKALKKMHNSVNQAADKKAQQHRDETGRQRQQYSHKQQSANRQQAQQSQQSQQTQGQSQQAQGQAEPQARRTQTSTGETIIDHRHQERGNKKIFDDQDGEYVDFVEEK